MLRNACAVLALAVLLVLSNAPKAAAQEWANKMFKTTTHDFGTLARGAKAEFRFQVKNIYEEPAHIASVRSSCGCTTPVIVKPDLKTFETGEIVAEFNTKAFLGYKSATITVTFDKPFHAEVQLNVTGQIRSDVVLTPGAVDLGSVDHGTAVEKKLAVTFAGKETWKIIDAKTVNPHFQVELVETGRGRGKVAYELLVRLTKDAPVGYIKDQLILVTNDPQATELPVDIEGQVVSEITVSPASLFLGVVQPGQKVTKQLVVRGKKPFKITDVRCDDAHFEIKASSAAKAVHLIPVIFTAGETAGKVQRKISLETDQGENVVPTFTAYAQVVTDAKPTRAAARTEARPEPKPRVKSAETPRAKPAVEVKAPIDDNEVKLKAIDSSDSEESADEPAGVPTKSTELEPDEQ